MATRGEMSPARQWFWALVILGAILGGIVVAWLLRDTEFVDPTVAQEQWLEWRTRR